MVAFMNHRRFNLEVVSCALYLLGVTELPFKLLALQAKITALYLMVNNNRIPDVFQKKRKRGRPAAWRITRLPINKTVQNREWRRIRQPRRRAQTSITRQALDSNLQTKWKRRRPALTRRRTLPVKMFTCHSCLLRFQLPRVSATRVFTIIGCVVIRFVFTSYCKKLKLKYFDTVFEGHT